MYTAPLEVSHKLACVFDSWCNKLVKRFIERFVLSVSVFTMSGISPDWTSINLFVAVLVGFEFDLLLVSL